MLERLREVRETVAPRHMSKLTLEDDIGMIHELTQVSRHNALNRVSWAETCLPNHWHIYLLLTNGLLHLYL